MNEQKNKTPWRSFQGCVTAGGPLIVSGLFGFALYKFLQPSVEPGLARWTAIIISLCVFGLIATLRIDHERKCKL
jgi:hypothetical protein